MNRHYRYRCPPWLRRCICILEKCILPILIFQLIRTLLFPSTLDIFLLGIIIGMLLVFHLDIL